MKASRKKVLVADCHEEVLIALEKMLEDAGFDTTTAWTAASAVKLLDSQVFDLALVNDLPDATCGDLLTALRRRSAQMPCILMRPGATEMNAFASLRARGVSNIVCKYDYRKIVRLVSDLLACDKKAAQAA